MIQAVQCCAAHPDPRSQKNRVSRHVFDFVSRSCTTQEISEDFRSTSGAKNDANPRLVANPRAKKFEIAGLVQVDTSRKIWPYAALVTTLVYTEQHIRVKTGRYHGTRKSPSLFVSLKRRNPADAKFTVMVAATNPTAPNPDQRTRIQSRTPLATIPPMVMYRGVRPSPSA